MKVIVTVLIRIYVKYGQRVHLNFIWDMKLI